MKTEGQANIKVWPYFLQLILITFVCHWISCTTSRKTSKKPLTWTGTGIWSSRWCSTRTSGTDPSSRSRQSSSSCTPEESSIEDSLVKVYGLRLGFESNFDRFDQNSIWTSGQGWWNLTQIWFLNQIGLTYGRQRICEICFAVWALFPVSVCYILLGRYLRQQQDRNRKRH